MAPLVPIFVVSLSFEPFEFSALLANPLILSIKLFLLPRVRVLPSLHLIPDDTAA
jgi:hypothetical protein